MDDILTEEDDGDKVPLQKLQLLGELSGLKTWWLLFLQTQVSPFQMLTHEEYFFLVTLLLAPFITGGSNPPPGSFPHKPEPRFSGILDS